MIRIMVILWAILAAGVGVGLFLLKHEVQALEEELLQTNRTIRVTQESIHVLKAEWSFLNDPARLQRLAERHLGMILLKPGQITVAAALSLMLDALEQGQPSHRRSSQMAVAPAGEGRVIKEGRRAIKVVNKAVTSRTAVTGKPVPHLSLPAQVLPSDIRNRVTAVTNKQNR